MAFFYGVCVLCVCVGGGERGEEGGKGQKGGSIL